MNNIDFKVIAPDKTEHTIKCGYVDLSPTGALIFRSTSGRGGKETIVRSFAHGHWAHFERLTEVVLI